MRQKGEQRRKIDILGRPLDIQKEYTPFPLECHEEHQPFFRKGRKVRDVIKGKKRLPLSRRKNLAKNQRAYPRNESPECGRLLMVA
jgi:hypothetical protein